MASGRIKFLGCGRIIREARRRRRVGQRLVVQKLGWSSGQLSKYETNRLAISDFTLEEIAQVLNIDPLDLIIECLLRTLPISKLGGKKSVLRQQLYAAMKCEKAEESD